MRLHVYGYILVWSGRGGERTSTVSPFSRCGMFSSHHAQANKRSSVRAVVCSWTQACVKANVNTMLYSSRGPNSPKPWETRTLSTFTHMMWQVSRSTVLRWKSWYELHYNADFVHSQHTLLILFRRRWSMDNFYLISTQNSKAHIGIKLYHIT